MKNTGFSHNHVAVMSPAPLPMAFALSVLTSAVAVRFRNKNHKKVLKSEMSVSERHRARVKWRQANGDCSSLSPISTPASGVDDFQDLVAPGGWPELAKYEISSTEFRTNLAMSTTLTYSPPPEANSMIVGEIPKKRKANTNNKEVKSKVGNAESEGEKSRDKRIKQSIEEEEESKITEQTETSKQNSKASEEVQKSDYVHVRARRGQATDSHSLAERARREKISERMKYLQNLVPGCNKIAGKAGMLDEIINYVQSLQQQVEFLSMKLATLNPRLDFINVDDLLSKQENLQVFPTIEISPETANSFSCFNQLEIGSSSVTVPQSPLMNSASITHFELCSTWGDDLQSLYSMSFEQGGPPLLSPSSFLSQQYSGIEDEKETFLYDKVVVPF